MPEVFAVSFRLRNAYRTNSIIYSLKSLPLIRKLLPQSLYASRDLKLFVNIISGIIEFFAAFLGKALYLLLIWTQTQGMTAAPADSFAHMIVFLTIAGGFLNTQIFNPTKDKYYAMFSMQMDAKRYTLTAYVYFLIKMLAGFTVFSLIFGRLCGASLLTCLAVPVYVVCMKLIFAAISIYRCKKHDRALNENKPGAFMWAAAAVLTLAAVIPPYPGYALPELTLTILAAALIIPSVPAAIYIARFDRYRRIYKELLVPSNVMPAAGAKSAGAAAQLAMQKKLTADTTLTSTRSGYRYFNELFMKRHSRLLTKSALRITVICALMLAAAVAVLYFFPESRAGVNELLMTFLPYFLFIMYCINRGKVITQAMFMNCDHSMLAYRFYRQPKALLSLFVDRLKYIILINLIPASVIALGLPLLLLLTGGTDDVRNYAVLFVSIIAMSVFFSVHNIVLYYLLQPYNVNLEMKSAAYGLINWVTYIVCYSGIQFELPTLAFGSAISAFCIVYAAAAFILAYRLAPKTFKLRG